MIDLSSPDLWRSLTPMRFFWTEDSELSIAGNESDLLPRRLARADDKILLRSLRGEAKNLQGVVITKDSAQGPWGAIDAVLTPKGAVFGLVFRPALSGVLHLRPDVVRCVMGEGKLADQIQDVYNDKGARAAVLGDPATGRFDLFLAAKSRWMRERFNVKLLSLAKDEKL